MKNILLTGGAGYIGSHVAHLLIDKGYAVTVIDSLITGNEHLVPNKAKLEILNLRIVKKLLMLIFNYPNIIIKNLATLSPKQWPLLVCLLI